MGNIRKYSLKWAFVKYFIPCIVLSVIGVFGIGHSTNYLQDWYYSRHKRTAGEPKVEIEFTDEGEVHYKCELFQTQEESVTFWFISNAQFVLIPLWMLFCVLVASLFFYNFELKEPINSLLAASKKISESQLDFQIQYKKQNELGMLCQAFEDMRLTLYENNRDMWKSLEERKRLNSAFSHDLRTPLTVLKGYVEFLQQYVPDNKISEEKLLSVLAMMNGQVTRLEHYTQKMNAVQKLEDIIPNIQPFSVEALMEQFTDTGRLLCSEKQFQLQCNAGMDIVRIDTELVMQVYENLISNAVRYARSTVDVTCTVSEHHLEITVFDDGNGFTEAALQNAAEPFFRDEKGSAVHFGLGLYICRILCQKCDGSLTVSNHGNGGCVTASFSQENTNC